MLASLLFPYDNDAPALIDSWLIELEREHCIDRYEVNGASYIQIAKWLSHQKIDRPSESKIPPFDESSRVIANPREPSSLDQGSRIKDQGRDQGEERAKRSQAVACPPDMNAGVWDDWLKLRKAKKAPVTETVVSTARDEAKKAGMSFEDFLRVWCTRGSQGLQADWLKPHERGSPQQPAETTYQRSMRERMAEFAPGIAAKAPTTQHQPPLAEVIDVTARRLG
jgi:hypothetical protein